MPRASDAERVTALRAAHVARPSVKLADYRTEYRLLGPLEVVYRGEAVPTGGQRKRALLARLLLEANRTVSVDALVDSLWGERVPSTAVKMVHIYVSQLRKVLPSGALQTRPPGYRLEVAPEAVDLQRFERLRKEGREALAGGDAATAAERLSAACALWRGPALGEFSEPFAAAGAAHLDELRLLASEDRVDAELALGRHRDVVRELRALVASHPFRERPRRQLMLALYRQGRHAEALSAFHEVQAALRDELGIDPSAGLAELQYRILNQDPALDHASPTPAPPHPGPVAGAPRRRVRRPGGGAVAPSADERGASVCRAGRYPFEAKRQGPRAALDAECQDPARAVAADLIIDVDNTPGALAEVAAAISDAGVNIAAATCIGTGDRAELHILVPHAGAARHALAISHLAVSREREVVVVDVQDRPGVLADLTRRIARAGVDLDLVYVATRNRIVFGAADLDALRAALGGAA